VADVIHLIAELAENATIFSPPNTPVRVHGDVVGRGYAVEIEDRGLGLSDEKLADINQNFAHPPQLDLSGSEQLGLFVAGQLARRHDIQIRLKDSPYGGTTAIVLIPNALVVSQGAYDVQAGAAAGERAFQLTGWRISLHAATIAEPVPLTQLSAATTAAEPLSGPPGDTKPGPAGDSGNGPAASPGSDPAASPAAGPTEPIDSIFTPRPPRATAASPSGSFTLASEGQPGHPGDSDTMDSRTTSTELTAMGLPVRVRQASLAPQLRHGGVPPGDAADDSPDGPSPEAVRSTMTALQRGWERGRNISGAVTSPPETTRPEATPPETIPEPGDSGNGGEQRDDE